MKRYWAALLFALGACGEVSREAPDASSPDAPGDDAGIDAPPDPPPPPPPEAREVMNGGGRLTSSSYTLDIQIGHGVQQTKAVGTTYTLEGNAAVTP